MNSEQKILQSPEKQKRQIMKGDSINSGSDPQVQESQATSLREETSKEMNRREFLNFLFTSGIVLSGVGSISSLFSGCQKGKEVSIKKEYNFLDHLDEARIVTPQKNYVQRASFKIGGKANEVMFEHPDSQVTFKDVSIYINACLTFGIGINETAWEKEGDGVLFEIILTDDKSRQHSIYSRYIDPKNNFDDRKWFDETIDLKSFEGQKVSFTFKTSSGPKGNVYYDWAGWKKPLVVHSIKRLVPQKKKNNVILVSLDTLRADHIGCYGYKKNTTPNLDRFALEGIQFMKTISQCCWTLASHMSILTSLYTDVHKVVDEDSILDQRCLTLAEVMQQAGYIAAGFVRSCVWMDARFGFDQGFDTYSVTNENAAQLNQRIFSWLKEYKNENFFLFVHYYDIHSDWQKLPYDSPPPYNRMFLPDYKGDFTGCGGELCASEHLGELNKKGIILSPGDRDYIRGMYDGGIRYTDTYVGGLLTEIDRLGLKESTLVVITSDHGEEFQEHKKFLHDQIYNECVLVPLLMRFPRRIPANRRDYHWIESIDILPTILDLLKIGIHSSFQGKTLTSLINGNKNWKKSQVYTTGRNGERAVIMDNWKFIYTLPTKKKELYDLKNDPGEKVNVVESYRDKVGVMMPLLQKWMKKNEMWRYRFKIGKTQRRGQLSEKEIEKLESLGYIDID